MPENNFKNWRKEAARRVHALAPILYALSIHEDPEMGVGTFCVNPWSLEMVYNPKFAEKNSLEENAFILAHEATHVLCDHGNRRMKFREKEGTGFILPLWMMAEEMQVNDLVSTLSGWKPPKDVIVVNDECKGLTTEETYIWLKQHTKIVKQPCGGGKGCIHGDSGDQKEKVAGIGDAATEMVRESAIEASQKNASEGVPPGTDCGELKRIQLALKGFAVPADLRQMLRRYLTAMDTNCKHFDASTLYKRRMVLDGLCLPNLSSSPIAKKFVVSVDNSGSIGDDEFSEFKGILTDSARQLGFQEIVVQHFTTEVMKTERFYDLRKLQKMARQANGGTAIEDADFRAYMHKGQFHIILTDGYVGWLRRYMLPTVVVITQETEPPERGTPGLVGVIEAWKKNKK